MHLSFVKPLVLLWFLLKLRMLSVRVRRGQGMLRFVIGLIGWLLILAPAVALAAAAYVHDLAGKATVSSGSGPARALKIGDLIDPGNTIRTEPNGTATIKFEDGQVIVLRESTAFRVGEYVYNKEKIKESRAVFNLLAGGLRFISGVIGSTNPKSFRMTAGTMTIGIRGTDGDVTFDPVSQAVTAAVNAGVVELNSPVGTQAIPANAFSRATPTTPPSVPAPITQAPPAVQAAVTKSLAQANVPINTPVVVQASANAAVAQAQSQQAAAQATQAQAQAQTAQAVATAALAQNQPNAVALVAEAQAAQLAALQAADTAAKAATGAQQALSTAVQAAQAAYTQAVNSGATPPAPPAPPKPGASSSSTSSSATSSASTPGTTTSGTTSSSTTGTTDTNTPPATGAGTPGSTTSSSTSSSTPSGGAGGGAGGGGTASPN